MPLVILLALSAGVYCRGAWSARRRGYTWPRSRIFSFVAGAAALALAFLPPIATQDEDFRVHVLQHLLLAMLGPVLLALSAPVTLLLVTFRGYRRGLTRMLHSRTVHIAAHPLVGFILSIGAMYVLYLTPLYSATLRHPLLHEAIHAHFVLVGCLFAWAVVGVDSIPRRASLTTRGAVLLTALAAHAILAKLLYALGPSAASLPADATAEWKDGAQLIWYAGDAVELVFVTAFFAQWYLRGGRRLARVRDQAVLDSASAIGN